ncbi:hypothetical protein METBIDRAFT_47947 [Metschnikowia bicuspidata var. bicuspidata NRRL YB-4993]|uniref:Mitochondrial group I intron splicing factor CCM1 n=1 Tax=Metschnikowia bicuspidata var. bicuspidata NRRL YB-4993 TaxID=869754 RepID=A0A1A0GYZ9_9ASCO|nr:hypothetical protein METBIDRAFT_47947 [Metschnikowia bicuspidata var. bicuspidata NRRL YB-4993]OBA16999.1 hypothetical protein METBIDRAFT_47947 [Metschnikowia bicuspidata var. bicuspidata NRRL YB-4993]
MPRPFPLIRNFNNLVWNLKHYQPSSRRPAFRASRHPFCTNMQLRDVSYAYWFEETARDLGEKLVSKKTRSSKSHAETKPQKILVENAKPTPVLASAQISLEGTSNPRTDEQPEISREEIEIVRLFQLGENLQMYTRLQEYKNQGVVIPIGLLNEMASRVYDDLPTNSVDTYILQSVIEPPAFFLQDDLRYSKMYKNILSRLSYLHKSFVLYESVGLDNEKFLLHYIWLCYHQGDLQKLQKLLYLYLKCQTYDSRTLSYVINAFVYNYDVQFSKTLFDSVVAMKKPLSEALISSTLVAFVKVGALYDNLYDVFQIWLTSDNCESPYPKTVALLVEQTYKFGTEKETALVDKLCEALDYNNNSLVQMARDQSRILRRDPNQKKSLTSDDVNQILEVRNALGNSKHALKVYYESYIRFFGKYCTMTMVQLILKEMKKDQIPISKFAYDSIIQHYVANSKFVQLSKFMDRFVSKYINFEPIYIKQLFEAFIKTYPYHGEEFMHTFHEWLQKNENLSAEEKTIIGHECQITTNGSKMTPCAMKRKVLENHKKYDQSGWSNIKQSRGRPIAKVQKKHQIQFRLIEGIRGVMRKGIRPDYHIIENTLRNLNASLRIGILDTLSEMRMNDCATRLQIHHFLLGYPRKTDFSKFVADTIDNMSTSDMLLLARRSMNSYDFETTSLLLNSLKHVDMSDGRYMISLNLKLRNGIFENDFDGIVAEIERFPIDDITLSPYIYDQCRYIEKIIVRRIQVHKEEEESRLGAMNLALEKLRGLIGDIQVRLKKDDADIRALIQDSFRVLNSWIQQSRDHDERKT